MGSRKALILGTGQSSKVAVVVKCFKDLIAVATKLVKHKPEDLLIMPLLNEGGLGKE